MKVLQIDGKGRVVHEWDSPSEAAKGTGLDTSHIVKCLKGKRARHGGYSWRYGEGEVCEDSNSDNLESRSYDYREDSAILSAKTEKSITSLDEAIVFFEIDTEKWEVERFIVNSWDVTAGGEKRTNYQVKVFLKPRVVSLDEILVNLEDKLEKYTPKVITSTKTNGGTITAEFADFHVGAEVKDLLRTPDFDVNILSDYLTSAAQVINNYNAESVVVNLHGDFFESITGLNHDDVWKGLGKDMYGANAIIFANELIGGRLLSNINNLKEVNIVAGNHDRISAKRTVDQQGEGAKLLAWILQKDFPEIKINFDSLILVREIDGINHIMTHGHHGISKKDLAKVVADYGDSNKFNLWTEGHIHSRLSKKVMKSKVAVYDTVEFVSLDEQKYRKVVLPPLFTGNFYSESIGYSGYAGFLITYNNGKGIPNIHDYTI